MDNSIHVVVSNYTSMPYQQSKSRLDFRRGYVCMEQCLSIDEAKALLDTFNYETQDFLEGAQLCIKERLTAREGIENEQL